MNRLLKSGTGWRVGWDAEATEFNGLLGSDDWALELTAAEMEEFCRLLARLVNMITQIRQELMDEETIACEVEGDLLWLEAEGYPDSYTLHLMLLTGRRGEGCWEATAVPALWQAVQAIQVF